MISIGINFIVLLISILFVFIAPEGMLGKKIFFFALALVSYSQVRFLWSWREWSKQKNFNSVMVYSAFSFLLLMYLTVGWLVEYDFPKEHFEIIFMVVSIILGHALLEELVLRYRKSSFVWVSGVQRWPLLGAILVYGIAVFAFWFDSKLFDAIYLWRALPAIFAVNWLLWPVAFYLSERNLINKMKQDHVSFYVNGKTWSAQEVLFESLQTIKTVAMQKKYFLTDGSYTFQEVNHRATMREQTVLNTFYQIFRRWKPEVADAILTVLDEPTELEFESEVKTDDKIELIDDFGVRYVLGTYEIAKQYTQDSNYSFYLTRGTTLFAKLLFTDSILEEQRTIVDALNQQPVNTVLISEELPSACYQVVAQLGLDKDYSALSEEQQSNILTQLQAKAPTAFVGSNIDFCKQVQVGFLLKSEDAIAAGSEIAQAFSYAKGLRSYFRGVAYLLMAFAFVMPVVVLFFAVPLLYVLLLSIALQYLFGVIFYIGAIRSAKAQADFVL